MEHLLTSKIAPENFMEYKKSTPTIYLYDSYQSFGIFCSFDTWMSADRLLEEGQLVPLEGLQEWSILWNIS